MACSLEDVKITWYEHFTRVLNITSHYLPKVIRSMPTLLSDIELDGPPTFEEMLKALSILKSRKADGKTEILP